MKFCPLCFWFLLFFLLLFIYVSSRLYFILHIYVFWTIVLRCCMRCLAMYMERCWLLSFVMFLGRFNRVSFSRSMTTRAFMYNFTWWIYSAWISHRGWAAEVAAERWPSYIGLMDEIRGVPIWEGHVSLWLMSGVVSSGW